MSFSANAQVLLDDRMRSRLVAGKIRICGRKDCILCAYAMDVYVG